MLFVVLYAATGVWGESRFDVRFEDFFQVGASSGEQRLYSLGRQSHRLGDFLIAHVFKLAQENGSLLSLVQSLDREADHFSGFPFVSSTSWHRAAGCLGHRVEWFRRILAAFDDIDVDLLSQLAAANGIAGDIVHNCKEPSGEPRTWLVSFPRPVDAEKDFLSQVFGGRWSDRMLEERNHSTLVFGDELLVGNRAALTNLQHQPHVGVEQFVIGRARRGRLARLGIVFDRQVRSPNECHRSHSNGLNLGWADFSQLAQIEPVHYAEVSLPASGQRPESRKRNRKTSILTDRPSEQAGIPSP